jgi:hypothetical protein
MKETIMGAQAVRTNTDDIGASAILVTILLAGLASEVVWETWARVVTPLLVGGPLEPAALVQSVFNLNDANFPQALGAIGLTPRAVAELIHLLVGLIAYPFGYIFIAQPVARTIVPFLPWWVVAIGYGIGLWVFALYIMAHLFAGLPPFLGFIPLAWASLAGHVLFALAGATVVKARLG